MVKRRMGTLVALVGLIAAVAVPAGATKAHTDFALAGEARALEVAFGDQGLTLGLALAQADSSPKAVGVGAGQCALLGETADPDDLPCSDQNTENARYPGDGGDENPTCSGAIPAPLDEILTLKVACGQSKAGLKGGVPFTTNSAKVAELGAKLPVGVLLPQLDGVQQQVDNLVDTLVDTLKPVLDQTPAEVRDAVEQVLQIVEDVDATDALKIELGPSVSNITNDGNVMKVESSAAGARIGILGIPGVAADGTTLVQTADPLENGLVIIEVGPSQASAIANKATAVATSAASAAIVTVKVRDITKPDPTYVEVAVAPGQTVTVLEGTPAESTITAANAVTSKDAEGAKAAADAVRLHLLKGVNGGLKLGLSRSTAAATVAAVEGKTVTRPAPKAPRVLPHTGANDMTLPAIGILLLAGVAFVIRRRITA
jgi:LPXTG-motif cell wall-anchored protein